MIGRRAQAGGFASAARHDLGSLLPTSMPTIQTEHFDYSEAEGVATIRLNRPERLNALTFDSYAELRDTFVELRTRESARAVVITGTGRAFCSGGER